MTDSPTPHTSADSSWKDRKSEIFAIQERNLRLAEQEEHRKATAMIRTAIQSFLDAGIAPHPLRAHPYRGTRSVKTTLTGWYLKSDRTVGIDTDGNYYILTAPGDLLTRLRGASPAPTLAPLVVGRGGRDGESFNMADLLTLRLTDPVPPARIPGTQGS